MLLILGPSLQKPYYRPLTWNIGVEVTMVINSSIYVVAAVDIECTIA